MPCTGQSRQVAFQLLHFLSLLCHFALHVLQPPGISRNLSLQLLHLLGFLLECVFMPICQQSICERAWSLILYANGASYLTSGLELVEDDSGFEMIGIRILEG